MVLINLYDTASTFAYCVEIIEGVYFENENVILGTVGICREDCSAFL